MIEGLGSIYRLTGSVKKPSAECCEKSRSSHPSSGTTTSSNAGNKDAVTLADQDGTSVTNQKPAEGGNLGNCAFVTLTRLVAKILQDQHTAERIHSGDYETNVIDKITPENAKALVASDDWQPEKTAAKIFSFSMTICGNNRERMGAMKESIAEGFELAKQVLGNEMPDTAKKTFSDVMRLVENWESDQ